MVSQNNWEMGAIIIHPFVGKNWVKTLSSLIL